MERVVTHLIDWLTTEEFPIASKLTSNNDGIFHDHNFYEIFYIVRGSINHIRNNDESKKLSTGDIQLMCLNQKHIFLRDEGNNCIHRDIIIRKPLFEHICKSISEDFFNSVVTQNIIWHATLSISQVEYYESKFAQIEFLSKTNVAAGLTLAKFILTELLGNMYAYNLKIQENTYPAWFKEMIERINDLKILKGGIKSIIEPYFFSKEHISRTFKKYLGITMTEYINQKRIFEAANMLLNTNLSVAQICKEIGFESDSYFNELFKKQYNVTPLQFRLDKQ